MGRDPGGTGCGGGDDAGGGGDGPAVDRYDATGDVPRAGAIEASDGRLVGLTAFDNTRRDAVVVSHDGGRTWRAADLPDEAVELGGGRRRVRDAAAVGRRTVVAADGARRLPRRPAQLGRERPLPVPGPLDRSFEPVEGTERDGVDFGDPVREGDRLLLPEFDDDQQLVGFTALG